MQLAFCTSLKSAPNLLIPSWFTLVPSRVVEGGGHGLHRVKPLLQRLQLAPVALGHRPSTRGLGSVRRCAAASGKYLWALVALAAGEPHTPPNSRDVSSP